MKNAQYLFTKLVLPPRRILCRAGSPDPAPKNTRISDPSTTLTYVPSIPSPVPSFISPVTSFPVAG